MLREKIKVLHVYRSFFPETQGGVEEAIRQIVNSSSKSEFDIRVFCLSNIPNPNGIKVDDIDVFSGRKIGSIASCEFGLIHAFKVFKKMVLWADVIHYHFPWPFMDLLFLLFASANSHAISTARRHL